MNKKLTEQAIALKYEAEKDNAPKVIAKGKGYIADKIIALAAECNIPVREDADLMHVLEAIDIDAEIPVEAFTAVAEILGYIYKQNDAMKIS